MPTGKPVDNARTPLLTSESEKRYGYRTDSQDFVYQKREKRVRFISHRYNENGRFNDPPGRCSIIFFATLAVVFSMMGIMTFCGVGPWAPPAEIAGIKRRIAIIGTGASGASVAYHLAKLGPGGSQRDSLEITVFEKSPVAGGRCLTIDVPYTGNLGLSVMKVELGTPGYNTNLDPLTASLVMDVGLQAQVVQGGRWAEVQADWDLGIYNGRDMLFRQPYNAHGIWYWWTSLGYFIRYGWAHKDLEAAVKRLSPLWNRYVQALSFPSSWSQNSATELLPPDLRDAITSAANTFLESKNMKHPFTTEQVQSRTRARYGANLAVLSGMQALRVMDEASDEKVKNVNLQGGMAQLFTRMLHPRRCARNTEVKVKLGTMVAGIWKNQTEEGFLGWTVAHWPVSQKDNMDPELTMEEFDEVVVAAPWHFTGMNIQPGYKFPEMSWEKMHVTVFTSPHKLAPQSFGLGMGDYRGMPQRVLSTLNDSERDKLNGYSGEAGVGNSGWWSIEHVGTVNRLVAPPDTESCDNPASASCIDRESVRTENVFRILSPSPIENEKILEFLGTPGDSHSITWVYRHFWEHAFQTPLRSDGNEEYPIVKVDDGLWYTGGMEGVWGGVESSISIGKRVAEEIRYNWSGNKPLRGTVMRGTQW